MRIMPIAAAVMLVGSVATGVSHAALLDRPRALGVLWRVLMGAVFYALACVLLLARVSEIAWAVGLVIGLVRRRLRRRQPPGGAAEAARPLDATDEASGGERAVARDGD